jgi:hypothetical protein
VEEVGDADGETKEYAYYSNPNKTVSQGTGDYHLTCMMLHQSMGVAFVIPGRLICNSSAEPMLGELGGLMLMLDFRTLRPPKVPLPKLHFILPACIAEVGRYKLH